MVGWCVIIYQPYASWLAQLPEGTMERKSAEAELLFRRLGITFAVYGESAGSERLIPFDIVPRIFWCYGVAAFGVRHQAKSTSIECLFA